MKRAAAAWKVVSIAVVAALTGCSGSAMNATHPPSTSPDITVGLILPLTGPYQAISEDMRDGWQIYLDQHGGKLGGHTVHVVTADEAEGGPTARASADKLINHDHAAVIVGAASADTVNTVAAVATTAKVPFIGVGGRPSNLGDVSYVWHTSFLSTDYGKAIAAKVHATVPGPVYVIGPDYVGGHDEIGGFVQAFTAAGGTLANPGGQPTYTPWPDTQDFAPWLTKIRATGAKAVYAFYAGAPAVGFVKQYAQFTQGIPLYSPAFLTEGGALQAEGQAAAGIYTVANYAAGLTTPANTTFTQTLSARYQRTGNVYNMTSYDAADLLDKAIGHAGGNPSGSQINQAIAALGPVTDSPRGSWHFDPATHTPVQPWYLRQVQPADGAWSNTLVQPLGTFGG